jgi:TPR repeat protein
MESHPLSFLRTREAALFRLYVQAERLSSEDPGAACVKLRVFAESVVQRVCALERLPHPSCLADGLNALGGRRVSTDALRRLNDLRVLGNQAAHASRSPSAAAAVRALGLAHAVGAWFAETYLGVLRGDVTRFVPPDPTASMHAFRDAVLGGDAEAQYQIAVVLVHRADEQCNKELQERGVTFLGPYHDAIDWLRKAQHEVPAARSMLAQLMWRNIERPQYPEEPVDLLESAAADGDPEAHATLGHARLLAEHGLTLDYEAARRHFEAAALEDHPVALNGLVKIHADGLGTPVDGRKALDYARRAAEAGYAIAQHNLALMMVTHEPPSPTRDDEIMMWFTKAADGGFPPAMHTLYRSYRDGNGAPADPEQSLKWRTAALEHNEPRTCYDMGLALEAGDGVTANTLAALRMFERALIHAPPELPGLTADAKAKMREMILRNRAEIRSNPASFSTDELNERILVELASDDEGDPLPDFRTALVQAFVANANKTPAEMLLAVA